MGQRFSDLRAYMLTMDQLNDDTLSESKRDGDNGNVSDDQRFENIYASKNDTSDELNANDGDSHDCTCACAGAPRTRACRRKDEPGTSRRTSRSSSSGNVKKCRAKRKEASNSGPKKKAHWGVRLTSCTRQRDKSEADLPLPDTSLDGCVCTGYRRMEQPAVAVTAAAAAAAAADAVVSSPSTPQHRCVCGRHRCTASPIGPAIDLNRFNPEDFPIEDCDERARLERAREMAEGVDPPPGFVPALTGGTVDGQLDSHLDSIAAFFQARLGLEPSVAFSSLSALSHIDMLSGLQRQPHTHSQADYIHCLVPDLLEITRCSYYWGKMDRYEAERLLEGRPEGTFLLRDSAQEEHLFSVSFRKYNRSLHARIEQWNHKFSFDSHDPGVFSSATVVSLIEHYKDPSFCMFFEPMLTIPLHRTFPFPLQHLCRAVITKTTNYDAVNRLPLPRSLKVYLREYHYKQRLRIRYLDSDL